MEGSRTSYVNEQSNLDDERPWRHLGLHVLIEKALVLPII